MFKTDSHWIFIKNCEVYKHWFNWKKVSAAEKESDTSFREISLSLENFEKHSLKSEKQFLRAWTLESCYCPRRPKHQRLNSLLIYYSCCWWWWLRSLAVIGSRTRGSSMKQTIKSTNLASGYIQSNSS